MISANEIFIPKVQIPATISGVTVVDSLPNINRLNAVTFMDSVFKNVTFPDFHMLRFDNCTLEGCKFESHDNSNLQTHLKFDFCDIDVDFNGLNLAILDVANSRTVNLQIQDTKIHKFIISTSKLNFYSENSSISMFEANKVECSFHTVLTNFSKFSLVFCNIEAVGYDYFGNLITLINSDGKTIVRSGISNYTFDGIINLYKKIYQDSNPEAFSRCMFLLDYAKTIMDSRRWKS